MKHDTHDGEGRRIVMSEVYRKNSTKVARFIKRYVCDADLAEELRQDVFAKLWERGICPDPDGPGTLTFLFTVAKHSAIDHLRRKKLERRKLRCMNLDDVMLDRRFYEDVENSFIRGEVISTMCDVINSFPEEKRRVFIEKNFHISRVI